MCHEQGRGPGELRTAGDASVAAPATRSVIGPREAAAAGRAFYRDALRGREVWQAERAGPDGSLWFVVGGRVVEVRPNGRDDGRLELQVDEPGELAARCWDAGFVVQVHDDARGQARFSVVDPFGRPVDLAPADDDDALADRAWRIDARPDRGHRRDRAAVER